MEGRWATWGGAGDRGQEAVISGAGQTSPGGTTPKERKEKKTWRTGGGGGKKKKDAHKFQNQKDDALARHTVWAASQRGCVRTAASAAKGLGGSGDGPARPSLAGPRTHAHARTHARTLARATPPSPAPGKGL